MKVLGYRIYAEVKVLTKRSIDPNSKIYYNAALT